MVPAARALHVSCGYAAEAKIFLLSPKSSPLCGDNTLDHVVSGYGRLEMIRVREIAA